VVRLLVDRGNTDLEAYALKLGGIFETGSLHPLLKSRMLSSTTYWRKCDERFAGTPSKTQLTPEIEESDVSICTVFAKPPLKEPGVEIGLEAPSKGEQNHAN
jgi:hypothetical protein